MKMPIQKNVTDPRKSKYVQNSSIIRLLFHTKVGALLRKDFPRKLPTQSVVLSVGGKSEF